MQPLSDRREEIVRQKREIPALEFAGFWRRLVALLIDVFAVAVICSIIMLTFAPYHRFDFGLLWSTSDILSEPLWRAVPYLIAGNVLSLLVNIAYFVGFWVWRGQTPGKMLLGIKLVRQDGSKVTIGVALLRYLGYIVSAAVLFIGFLWIAFDDRKQGFHDKMAETYVVRIPEAPITAPAAGQSVGG
jgi:uncharacterized RDD family membrane protein YckC